MSRHRRRPAARNRAPARSPRSPLARAGRGRIDAAVRRVVVTPTFAAGLGIVIAAVLVVPMSRIGLRLSPAEGRPCPARGCGDHYGGGVGSLASAPSRRLATRSPAARAHGPQPSATPFPAPSGGPVLDYQGVGDGAGRFTAALSVVPISPVPANGWTLRVRFPAARAVKVWGGSWRAVGKHTLVIRPHASGGQQGRQDIQVFVALQGPAGPPAAAFLDGQACQVKVVAAGGNGGGGGYGGSHGGGGQVGMSGGGASAGGAGIAPELALHQSALPQPTSPQLTSWGLSRLGLSRRRLSHGEPSRDRVRRKLGRRMPARRLWRVAIG